MTVIYPRRRTCAGFSLVEMMVAMTIGLLILLAVSEVFINNNRSFVELEKTSRQIENGRYAMQLLENELANAGFFGESSGAGLPSVLPPACVGSAAEVEASLGVPVYGGATVFSSGTDCRGANVHVVSDYLAVRRSSTCAVGSTGCDGFSTGAYHLRVSGCNSSGPLPGTVTLATSETDAMLATVKARNCTNSAPTYRYLNRLYYVSNTDVLMRAELQAGGNYQVVPLVDGVERLHFAYGVDDDDDGGVDRFLAAANVDSGDGGASWGDVVAVRIWLVARNSVGTSGHESLEAGRVYDLGSGGPYRKDDPSDTDDYGFDPSFKRQLYVSTVRLNNAAGRREAAGNAAEDSEAPSDPNTGGEE